MDVFLIAILLSALAMILCLCFSECIRPSSAACSEAPWIRENRHAMMPPLPIPVDVSNPSDMLIWATQIPALHFVCDREPRGAYYTPLKLIHIELAHSYPEIYDGCTFQRWVEFYIRAGLFHFEDDAIHITATGHELLSLLVDAYARQGYWPPALGSAQRAR